MATLGKFECIIVSSKEDLLNLFKTDTNNFLQCVSLDFLSLLNDTTKYAGDCVIIDSEIVNVSDLLHLRKTNFSNIRNVFYLADESNIKNFDNSVFENQRIDIVPPLKSSSDIYIYVCKKLGIDLNTKIISFFGTYSKVGVSSIISSLASLWEGSCNNKLCIVDLSCTGKDTLFNIPKDLKYLGDLQKDILNKDFNLSYLKDKNVIHEVSSKVYYVRGFETLLDARYFGIQHIESILDCLCGSFDTVWVDAGSLNDFQSFVGVFNKSLCNILVCGQSLKEFNIFLKFKTKVFDILKYKFSYIIFNKIFENTSDDICEYVVERLDDSKILGVIPYNVKLEQLVDSNNDLISTLKSKDVTGVINTIFEFIVKDVLKFELIQKKSGIFGW